MNHAYYLSRMPLELKTHIEAESIYIPWLKRGYTLNSIWSDSAVMESVYNQLSIRERNVLHILVTSVGCEPFDWTKLEQLAYSVMSGAEVKAGFLQLVKKGLLYAFRKSWGEQVFVMAHDGLALWQRILFADEAEIIRLPAEGRDEHNVLLTEEGGPSLAHDVFHSLVYFDQNEIKLTKNGTIHKRQLQKWLEFLRLRSDKLEGCGIKYAYADCYPASIAVIFDFMTRMQLIEQRGDELVLCEDMVGRWLMLNEAEQNKLLYSIWKQVIFPKETWIQHAVLLIERQPQNLWIQAKGILQWLRKYGFLEKASIIGNEELIGILEEQWIQPLIAFGWLERGSHDAHNELPLYRWRVHPLSAIVLSQEENNDLFYVQPDFELLVPPNASFAVRWELSRIADHHKSDPMSIYKLSKESLQRGLERGFSLVLILEFLEKYAAYGIPENVKLTLENWAKPFGKARFEQAILLRCEDAAVANTIRKLPGADECLIELIGERTWTVRTDQLNRLTVLLDKAGWMPGKLATMNSFGPSESQTQNNRMLSLNREIEPLTEGGNFLPAEKGFIYSRQSYIYFEMEQQLPSIQDLYPDLQSVPANWMKEFRTYHPSARREMVERALEWKTALQIRHSGGSDHIIAPRKLQETRGTWSMTGLEQSNRQEVCLTPEDWQEMKIIVPGIHEKY